MPSTSEKKKPQVSTSWVPGFSQSGASPPLGPPAYSKHDRLTQRYQKILKGLHWGRIVLAVLILGVSAATLGCSASALHQYATSKQRSQWMLPLWPKSIDLRPTQAILAFGVIMTTFSIIYIVLAFISIPRKIRVLNLASTIFSFIGLGLGLFALIFASIISSNYASAPISGSLVSWTCKWHGLESMTPPGFTKICDSGSVSLTLMLLDTLLQVLAVALSGVGWWLEMVLRQRGGLGSGSQVELV